MEKRVLVRIISYLFKYIPEGKIKCLFRAFIGKYMDGLPLKMLVNAGDNVVLVGWHRVDRLKEWAYQVGEKGSIVVIEAVPEYIENMRYNLSHHFRMPFQNVTYINKGVDSSKGEKNIIIGKLADYNKLAGQGIEDGLCDSDYERKYVIETDALDSIFAENNIRNIDHLEMTISGMELEALRGMPITIKQKGLRMQIRSLHVKNGNPIFHQVKKYLIDAGFKVILGPELNKFKGRSIYGYRC